MKNLGLVLSALVITGCSSTPASTPAPDLASVAAGGDMANAPAGTASMVSLTIAAPSSLTGTPRQLIVAAFDQFPVTGPPAGILYQGSPTIAAGKTVTVTGDASSLSGDKYVLAVLYMQGGGQLAPTAGVDYVSQPQKISFGGSVSIATLNLILLTPDGGF